MKSRPRTLILGLNKAGWVTFPLLLILALAPLHLGSNRTESIMLLACAAAGLFVILALSGRGIALAEVLRSSRLLSVALALYIVVLIWATLQTVTWTPEAWHADVWAAASQALGEDLHGRISMAPQVSREGVVRLSIYLAVFLYAVAASREPGVTTLLLRAVFVIAGVYASYGLYRLALGETTILWFQDETQPGVVTSSFINRSNFAAFAVMSLLCGVGLLLRRHVDETSWVRLLRSIMREFGAWRGLALAFSVIIVLALMLTGSRAAPMFGAVAILLFLMLAWRRGLFDARFLTVTLGVLAISGALIYTVAGDTTDRRLGLLADSGLEHREFNRVRLYEATVDIIEEQPWIGSGLGAFRYVFSAERPPYGLSKSDYGKAHNSYLENAVELGVPVALILTLSLFLCLLVLIRSPRRSPGAQVMLTLGLSLGVFAAGYSLVDFPLQIPANAILFSAVLGICCGTAVVPRRSDST